MVNGSVVFHRDVGYDFYLVSKNEGGEYGIKCISMPRAGAFHKELSNEVVIAVPRSADGQKELDQKIIAAYNALMGSK